MQHLVITDYITKNKNAASKEKKKYEDIAEANFSDCS
jgi:hypothetical protein